MMDEPQEIPQQEPYPLKSKDIIGIGFRLAGNLCMTMAGALNAISNEFFAACQYERDLEAKVTEQANFFVDASNGLSRFYEQDEGES